MSTARPGGETSQQQAQRIQRTLASVTQSVLAGMPQVIQQAGLVLVQRLKLKLSQPGTGRLYKSRGITARLKGRGTRGRATQLHQASAPGEPPAVDLGFLRASIGAQRDGDSVIVGTGVRYAPALEYGTTGRVRSVLGRRGPGVNRTHLAGVLRRASASRRLAASVRQRGTGTIAPRPFLRPSVEEALPAMREVVVSGVQSLVSRGARGGAQGGAQGGA